MFFAVGTLVILTSTFTLWRAITNNLPEILHFLHS
jgi:hypothetical protein